MTWEDYATPAALVTLGGFVLKALLDWRNDRRLQRQEPITENTAVVAMAKTAAEMALAQVADLRSEVTALRAEVVALRAQEDAWLAWYRDLDRGWMAYRQRTAPPSPPIKD